MGRRHDRRVLVGVELGFGRRIAGKPHWFRSEKITHPSHGPHCAVRTWAVVTADD
jgi:hypothetical protein